MINTKKNKIDRKSAVITAAVALAAVIIAAGVWLFFPIKNTIYTNEGISYEKAKVISVNSQAFEESKDAPGRNVGVQNVTVEFTSGRFKGETATFDNYLTSTHSIEVKAGTKVVVKCDRPEGAAPYYTLYQYDRSAGIIFAILIFAALLFAVGRKKGLMAGAALLISAFIIAGALIPLIYNGVSPILSTFIACVLITVVTLIMLNGLSKKTAIAMLSTFVGLTASVLLYTVIARILNVSGYGIEEAETLIMISRRTGLKISEVLFSGVLLASLGAVMDTTMSISSALYEISSVDAKISRRALFRSGMNMGSDMIGTMCQTLVLAFTGSALASLLVAVSYGTQFQQFFASDYFAVELFRSLTGSFAVILAVPVTSWIYSTLAGKRKR